MEAGFCLDGRSQSCRLFEAVARKRHGRGGRWGPARLESSLITLITAGSNRISGPDGSWDLLAGDLMLLEPDRSWQAQFSSRSRLAVVNVHCQWQGIPADLPRFLPAAQNQVVRANLEACAASFARGETAAAQAHLLAALVAWNGLALGLPPEDRIAQVLTLLQGQPALDRSALAASVGWHPGHLTARMRQRTGRSLAAHRRQAQLVLAKRLLVDGDRSLAEVAAAVGVSREHLARIFKRATGESPGAWRKRWMAW